MYLGQNRQKRESFLLGVFYSPKTSDRTFFDKLNDNIELAQQMSTNITIVGDLNEDYLKDRNHLKDALLLSSLTNVISVPTRRRAFLDPVKVPFEQHILT